MKKSAACLLVFALLIGTLPPARAAVGETHQSGISWYLELYGYFLPEDIQGEIQSDTVDAKTLELGNVVISSMETLYDGCWIYITASVVPSSTDEVIVMPGSASTGDLMRGGNEETARADDDRTFLEAAKEDNKRLLCVYIYLKEFDALPFYFLDHRQDAGDRSTLVSGSRLNAPGGEMDMSG